MQQIKLFKGVESEIGELQKEVNTWLKESGAKVLNIFGNISPQTTSAQSAGKRFLASDILIAVVYEE
ncbi:MAG: hypothetical protein ACR2GY_12275 [Phycisphaerales bacterium]